MYYNINKNKLFTFFLPLLFIAFLIVFQWKILVSLNEYISIKSPEENGTTYTYAFCKFIIELLLVSLCFIYPSHTIFRLAFKISNIFLCIFGFLVWFFADILKWEMPYVFGVVFMLYAEIWLVLGFSLFWGYANDICRITEAWNYYFAWAGIAILGGYNAGNLFEIQLLSKLGRWEYYCLTLVIVGIFVEKTINIFKTREKEDISCNFEIAEGVRSTATYKYIFGISLLSICYTVIMFFIENIWQLNIAEVFPEASYADAYMNKAYKVSFIMQMLVLAFFFLIHLVLYDPMRWKHIAMIPPVLMLGFGGLYLGLTFYGSHFLWIQSFFSMPLQQISLQTMLYLYFLPLSLKAFLLIPTLKMAFFPIPARNRFGVLVGVMLLFSDLAGKLSQWIYHQIASSQNFEIFVFLLFLVITLIWIFVVCRISRVMDRYYLAESLSFVQLPPVS
jgi:ATP/ADP translocase